MADLGFFACPDTSSDSEEEEEQPTSHEHENKEENKKPQSVKDDINKLPSPDTLFATVGKPDFLTTSQHFDWDRHVKVFEKDDDEPNAHSSGRYAAIAPPSGLNQDSETISRPPTKYSKVEASEVVDSIETGFGMKRQRDRKGSARDRDHTDYSQLDSGTTAKRKKGEWYREKEKRKRDIGQSSRDKSYVEEEKRILRQTYSVDQQLA